MSARPAGEGAGNMRRVVAGVERKLRNLARVIGKTRIAQYLFLFFDGTIAYHLRCMRYGSYPMERGKIVFMTYRNTYECNPKYIAEKIIERHLPYDMVWITSPSGLADTGVPPQIRRVLRYSRQAYREMASAQVWIDNSLNFLWRRFPKKAGQVYIETWHGSMGLKRVGAGDMKNVRWTHTARCVGRLTDFCISDSAFENGVYRETYWQDAALLEFGHPRNDILLCRDARKVDSIREKVCAVLGQSTDTRFLLYAPTFRDSGTFECYDVDWDALVDALQRRFGGTWRVLYRLHFHDRKKKAPGIGGRVIDATAYPDMQELLAMADAGLTDYSSWSCDYVLTGRPCFIYAKDLADYEGERGFYYPLDTTPFPIAQTNESLISNVLDFDENTYATACKRFLADRGCFEGGDAAGRVVDELQRIVGTGCVGDAAAPAAASAAVTATFAATAVPAAPAALAMPAVPHSLNPVKKAGVICGIGVLKGIFAVMKLLPAKRKVTFLSRQSNNPTSDMTMLAAQIGRRYPDVEIILLPKRLENRFAYCLHMLRQMYHVATSKVVVLDSYCMVVSVLKQRPGLQVIQMWHAVGSMKKFGYAMLDRPGGHGSDVARIMHMHQGYTDVLISSRGFIADFIEGFRISPDIVHEIPLPRVDRLLDVAYRRGVRERYLTRYPELAQKKNIVYCPTFRTTDGTDDAHAAVIGRISMSCALGPAGWGDGDWDRTKVEELFSAIDYERYNLIYRPHPLEKHPVQDGRVMNIPGSTADLLTVADYVVSDYSSIIYEACMLRIPVYLYAYDWSARHVVERLNIDLEHDAPVVFLVDAGAIIEGIESDDYDFSGYDDFVRGNVRVPEDGTCCEKIVEMMWL